MEENVDPQSNDNPTAPSARYLAVHLHDLRLISNVFEPVAQTADNQQLATPSLCIHNLCQSTAILIKWSSYLTRRGKNF